MFHSSPMDGKNNKALHIILAFLFCLTIISCGDDEEDTAKSSDNSTTSTSGSTETDNSSTADTTQVKLLTKQELRQV